MERSIVRRGELKEGIIIAIVFVVVFLLMIGVLGWWGGACVCRERRIGD